MTVTDPEVFISYASRDRDAVGALAATLERAGLSVWRDKDRILGGENYGPKIVAGIKGAKVMLLACSDASMRSRNVKQEIQLAWRYNVPYLPLLLQPTTFPEQVEYWLEGSQWIELYGQPESVWLPRVLVAMRGLGVGGDPPAPATPPADPFWELWTLARHSDTLWPVPDEAPAMSQGRLRDLGAVQDDVRHAFPLGSRLRLRLESEQDGHLLLIDQGTSGRVYCLCPSMFAPDTRIRAGTTELPSSSSPYRAFVATGTPGREHLLAVISGEPLALDWRPAPGTAARLLDARDLQNLTAALRALPVENWTALSTYFDLLPSGG